MSRLQERLRLGNRQDEGQLASPPHGRQVACRITGAEFLGDQELVQAACHCDPSGHGRSGIAALIESGDVISDLLQADVIQSKPVLVEPGEITVQIIGVGVDGTGRGPKLCCQGIEPELGQPLIGPHEFLLREEYRTEPVTDFLSKLSLCEMVSRLN
jgi:hypothetical protein